MKHDDFKSVVQTGDNKRHFVLLPGKNQEVYLTPKESVIVSLMMCGKRPKQIAWELENSLHTINSHLANIKEKFDCNNNFQLGYTLGWIGVNQPSLHSH